MNGPGGPRMRCVKEFRKECTGAHAQWWTRYDIDYPVKPTLALGREELVDGESVRVASGEILRNNICDDTVELRYTKPDGTEGWLPKLKYAEKGVSWYMPPWGGPGGHAFVSTSRGILRFKPDGSFQDFAAFASFAPPAVTESLIAQGYSSTEDSALSRLSPERRQAVLDAQAKQAGGEAVALRTAWYRDGGQSVDCAGNLWWVEYLWSDTGFNFLTAPRRLMKLPFTSGSAIIADPDLRASLAKGGMNAENIRLSAINQFGDIYLESHWRSAAWFTEQQTCKSNQHPFEDLYNIWPPGSEGQFLNRHPKIRAEGCLTENDELIQIDFDAEGPTFTVVNSPSSNGRLFRPNSAALNDGGICNSGTFTALPEKHVPLGHFGSYGIAITNLEGDRRPADLTLVRVVTVEGCANDGVTIRNALIAPFFNHQCIVLTGSVGCPELGCRKVEIPKLDVCPANFVKGNQPGNGYFQLVTVHSGTVKIFYQYDWPVTVPGWETPDPKKCGAGAGFPNDDQKNHCMGEMTLVVDAPTAASTLGSFPSGGLDGQIAYWSDRIGLPAPIFKAIVRRETSFNPKVSYRYEPLSSDFGDATLENWQTYNRAPFVDYRLLKNGNPPADNTCTGPLGGPAINAKDVNPRADSAPPNKYPLYFVTFDPATTSGFVCHNTRNTDSDTAITACGMTVGQYLIGNSGYTFSEAARPCEECGEACAKENCSLTPECHRCANRVKRLCPVNQYWFEKAKLQVDKTYGCEPLLNGADDLPCIIESMNDTLYTWEWPKLFDPNFPAQTVSAGSYSYVQVMFPNGTERNTISGLNTIEWHHGRPPEERGPRSMLAPRGATDPWYQDYGMEFSATWLRHVLKGIDSGNQNGWDTLTSVFTSYRNALSNHNRYDNNWVEERICPGNKYYPDVVIQIAAGCYESPAYKRAPRCMPDYCPQAE